MASERQALRSATKKEQIADAARTLFLAQGYAGTSMDAVTATAGVSKQTLYSYFPGKADLLSEIIAEEIATLRLADGPTPAITSLADLRSCLLAAAQGVTVRLMQEETLALLRLIVGEAIRLPELRDLIREGFPGQLLNQAQALIESAAALGLIHAPRPDLSARMFVGPLMSFIALDGLFRSEPRPAPDAATLGYIVDAFLATVTEASR